MKSKIVDAYSVTMTVGQQRGYHGDIIKGEELHAEIKNYQDSLPDEENCAVKVSSSKIQFKDYYEYCWDINVINYPRFPKPQTVIETFMIGLACRLMETMEQNRITVCLPDKHVMLEADNAEEN